MTDQEVDVTQEVDLQKLMNDPKKEEVVGLVGQKGLMHDFDPEIVLNFGKFKDDKIKLCDADEDYLIWITEQEVDPDHDFWKGAKGIRWIEYAKLELMRRRGNTPLETLEPQRPASKKQVQMTFIALDYVAAHLLRDFIQRPDKDETLTAWTATWIQQALFYGVWTQNPDRMVPGDAVCVVHNDLNFWFKVTRETHEKAYVMMLTEIKDLVNETVITELNPEEEEIPF